MPRFGSRSRANTADSSSEYNSPEFDDQAVSGFAASAAAGGVAASMASSAAAGSIISSGMPPPTHGTTGGGGNAPSSSRGHRRTKSGGKQKSITSGISTLFRRQPSPDLHPDYPEEAFNANIQVEPSGVHVSETRGQTRGQTQARGEGSGGNAIMKKMKSSGNRGRSNSKGENVQSQSRSRSRGGTPSGGGGGQYSSSQRQLLHGSAAGAAGVGAAAAGAAMGASYNQSQAELLNTALSPTVSGMSGGGFPSNLDHTQSLSQSLQAQSSSLSYNNNNNPSGSYEMYEKSMTSDTSDGEYSYESDGRGAARGASGKDGRGGTRKEMKTSSRKTKRSSPKRSRSKHKSVQQQIRLPRRYRGFSTSISSLFLDESIVCGAISCCGLLLSSRTEHLLNERNVKRGLTRRGVGGAAGRGKEGGRRSPSYILSVAWVVTILGVLATYAIWGFTNEEYDDWYDEGWYDENDDGGNGNNNDDGANGNQNDDGNQQNDDANAQQGDDAVQADDGANNYNDDGNQMNNDDANRKLNVHKSRELDDADYGSSLNQVSREKHSFIGVMKLRDQKEYTFDPVVGAASQAYTDLMSQFDADEYRPLQQLEQPQPQQGQSQQAKIQQHQPRLLESETNDLDQGQQARMIVVVLFLFMLGVIGRRRRMRTRFAILRSRAQDDHLYYASVLTKNGTGTNGGSLATPDNTVMENFHEREDKYDGACSHTLFGCYPVDTTLADYADYGDDDETFDDATVSTAGTGPRRKRKGGDFMSRTITLIFNCCCGRLCSCWCQFFSICALAQEAREARLLVPPDMQRIDLITHQPFQEYAKDVNNVRRRFMERVNRTWVQHYAALSHLSRYILLGFVLITGFVIMTMLLHPMAAFNWGDALVLIATFSQSFLVLSIVFGIFHRSDLSFDAVVKFFAVGFCICVPVGFVIEGTLINGLFSIVYVLYYLLFWIAGENFELWMVDNYKILSIVGELINAYFVAALVEELCKYYGFRFLEHPDLLFLTGLDRTAAQAKNQGGLDSYKYDSQLVSDFSRSHEGDGESVDSRGRRKRSKSRRERILREMDDEDDEPELRSLQQQAAAITTGMISVAVGLACAENFIYVFFLGGTGGDIGSISMELTVLLFRSIFPVHALSAAMQSINMIRKFIEERHGGTRGIGVGRIIFPAILLHGTFDAILMCVNAYIEKSWESYYESGGNDDDYVPYNALAVNLTASLGIIGVMVVSFIWYMYQNKLQMLRLARFDMNRLRSGQGDFDAPSLV